MRLLFCTILLHFTPFLNAQTTVPTVIEQVTVHLTGAEIIRTGTANLAPGRHEVRFTGLSPRLNGNTLQVTGDAGVEVLSVSSRLNFLEALTDPVGVAPLRDSIELLTDEMTDLQDELNAYEAERNLLLQNQKLGSQQEAVDRETLASVADFFRARLLEINRETTRLRRAKTERETLVGLLRGQLQQRSRQERRQVSEVIVTLERLTPGASELRLRYVCPDAGWSPVYDLRAGERLDQPIELTYRALAFNGTGVAWENVDLTLSTADVNQGATQPELRPWKLNNQPAYNFSANQSPTKNRVDLSRNQNMILNTLPGNLREEADEVEVVPTPPVQFQQIEVDELAKEFPVDRPYSIPADGRPYSIRISENALDADYKHYAVPKLDADAFLLAQIRGWEQLDLLPGPLNVYHEEDYVGLAELNPNILSDTLELSLGRDQRLVVQRTQQRKYTRKQFLGGNKISEFAYQISVKNNRRQSVTVELLDQLPISEIKEIEVRVEEISGAQRFADSGKLRWQFDLGAGETRTVELRFSIKHPSSMEVQTRQNRVMTAPRYF